MPIYKKIHEDTGTWDLHSGDQTYRAETPYTFSDSCTDILVATGFRQKNTAELAGRLGELGIGAAFCNLEFTTEVRLDNDVIEATVIEGLTSVMRKININAGRAEASPINVVGHCIGFAQVAKHASVRPGLVKELTGVDPFINTALSRKEILRRLGAAGLLLNISDDPDADRIRREAFAGITYLRIQEAGPPLKELINKGILKRLVFGENDPVSPPEEARQILGSDKIIEVRGGGHESLISDIGFDRLVYTIRLMKLHQRRSQTPDFKYGSLSNGRRNLGNW
jgi:hypothetical protein